jgi:hypothetical protein
VVSYGAIKMQRLDKGDYTIVIFTEYDPVNDNIDVEVQFKNGERYGATFFTPENLRNQLTHDAHYGYENQGCFVWCTDMVVVRDLYMETIEEIVARMIDSGELKKAFDRYDNLPEPERIRPSKIRTVRRSIRHYIQQCQYLDETNGGYTEQFRVLNALLDIATNASVERIPEVESLRDGAANRSGDYWSDIHQATDDLVWLMTEKFEPGQDGLK